MRNRLWTIQATDHVCAECSHSFHLRHFSKRGKKASQHVTGSVYTHFCLRLVLNVTHAIHHMILRESTALKMEKFNHLTSLRGYRLPLQVKCDIAKHFDGINDLQADVRWNKTNQSNLVHERARLAINVRLDFFDFSGVRKCWFQQRYIITASKVSDWVWDLKAANPLQKPVKTLGFILKTWLYDTSQFVVENARRRLFFGFIDFKSAL